MDRIHFQNSFKNDFCLQRDLWLIEGWTESRMISACGGVTTLPCSESFQHQSVENDFCIQRGYDPAFQLYFFWWYCRKWLLHAGELDCNYELLILNFEWNHRKSQFPFFGLTVIYAFMIIYQQSLIAYWEQIFAKEPEVRQKRGDYNLIDVVRIHLHQCKKWLLHAEGLRPIPATRPHPFMDYVENDFCMQRGYDFMLLNNSMTLVTVENDFCMRRGYD